MFNLVAFAPLQREVTLVTSTRWLEDRQKDDFLKYSSNTEASDADAPTTSFSEDLSSFVSKFPPEAFGALAGVEVAGERRATARGNGPDEAQDDEASHRYPRTCRGDVFA